MARAFYRPTPANTVEDYTHNTYYHKASDSYFAMVRRGNEYFQQQYQIGFDGRYRNVPQPNMHIERMFIQS